jgi:ParB family chromosome partitioning protein
MNDTVSLDRLKYGHEATPPINARKVGREDDVESLAASIAAHGLGQALNVKEIGGEIYVADGNRRLAALRLNASKGLISADEPIDCRFGEGGDELSLALNIERVPMHLADEYQKFHELHAGGLTDGDIAQRFGIEVKRVRRMLAVGALAPVVLDAWRNDEFPDGDRAFASVCAFTLASTIEDQERVFKRLKKQGALWSNSIRGAFGAGNREAARLVKFIGVEAYRAAGGLVVEDLFSDDHAIADPGLAERLANDKLKAKVDELAADGWSWASLAADLPSGWSYSWQKLGAKKKASAEDKARSGAVVALGYEGSIDITYGVLKPSATKAEKKVAKKTGEPEKAPTISNALMQRLSVQLTAAAKGAIVDHPHTALAALVAGLQCSMYGIPVQVRAEGLLKEGREIEDFSAVFERLRGMTDAEIMAAAAHEVSFCLDMQRHSADDPPLATPMFLSFCDALDEESSLQASLLSGFDAEDYFKTVARPFAIAAIAEAVNPDEARKAEKLRKPDLVKFAIENVIPTGWLPPELRTSGYAGPKAAAVEAKPKRKKAA